MPIKINNGSPMVIVKVGGVEMREVTVNGQVVHKRSTMHFHTNGGSLIPSMDRTYQVQTVPRPVSPTKPGYFFTHWTRYNSQSSNPVTFPFTTGLSDTNFYAWYIPDNLLSVRYLQNMQNSMTDKSLKGTISSSGSDYNTEIVLIINNAGHDEKLTYQYKLKTLYVSETYFNHFESSSESIRYHEIEVVMKRSSISNGTFYNYKTVTIREGDYLPLEFRKNDDAIRIEFMLKNTTWAEVLNYYYEIELEGLKGEEL